MSTWLIIGVVLATWSLLLIVGNEKTRQLHEVQERHRARMAAAAAAEEAAEAS